MSIQLLIPGQPEAPDRASVRGGPPGSDQAEAVTELLDNVDVLASFNLSPSARARTAQPSAFEAEDDDILEIEVEGGFKVWTSARRYSEEVPLLKPEARSGDGRIVVDTLPRTSERGVTDWIQTGLRILRLRPDGDPIAAALADPAQWPDDLKALAGELGLKAAIGLPAWFATKLVLRLIENRLNPGPGLYKWGDATRKLKSGEPSPAPVSFDGFDVEQPMLVFIHGTMSCTLGSFGAFKGEDAQPHWQALERLFGDRIYAFEHRSMSDSPIDNAIDLLAALPRNARVNIVSHSRGGLIGDLVSLTGIGAHLITRFDRRDPELRQVDKHDADQLQKLARLIAEKQLRVERFVRCASPSRGTLFVSENLDNFLSVLTNLVGLIPGIGGTPLYEVAKRLTLEIVKNRTKPGLVPGVEAVMPASPIVALLNDVEGRAAGAVGVLSGDVEGGSWFKRLGVFVTDELLYEGRDNDLVVNTDAMFHGARRELACYVFDQGADVSHFNYFKNHRTRTALVDWLAAKPGAKPEPFKDIAEDELEPVPMLRSMQTRAGADQPIVFVLPGIMGSHLNVGDREVWLRYLALLRGGLGDLADVDTDAVRPVALVGGSYRELCESLQNSHEVIPFAYDWRRSVVRAAKDLADEVEKALNRTRQPVRIVAHSMGGLVARAMIATRPEVWDRICERAGGRLVMLGTPNRGSHDIVEALLGTAATVRQLALLDFEHDAAGITGIIAGFPGVLELLPDAEEFFGEAHWQRYRPTCPASAVPRPGPLTDARKVRKGLPADTPLKHAEHVCYVAGASGRTVTGVELVDGRVVLSATSEGDGRVTYESGRLPGVPMWYMDAVHGDLAAHAPGFAAIRDLLETGTTSRLPTAPPSTARGGEVRFRTLPEPVLYPTESSLAAGVLGQRRARAYRRRAPAGFRVAVLHGDLRHSRFPIVVGHYEGDTIIGAEAQVDGLLGGALSQRYALGVYPGEFGSIAVVLQTPTAVQEALALPSGGIVIGLGKMGDLTASQLGDLIRRAALQYVLQLRDARPRAAAEPLRAGLSILLIGGNSTTNIAVGDSVGAILRGVAQANRELDSRGEAGAAIAEIEIVELYQDTAIEAAHAVKRLAKLVAAELDMDIEAVPLLQRGRDGRPRLAGVASRDAWRRWEISVVRPERKAARPRLPGPLADRLRRAVLETGQPDAELLAALAELALGDLGEEKTELHREIRFLTLSDRARAEATFQQRQPELIERLIKDSISQTRFRAEDSRVLFELTVPNELKSGLAQLDNLVLVVDDETAAYPWELMSAGTKPLCLAKGLVRQLQTSRYRPQIGARAGTAAYVVGDPVVSPPFQQLAGAREEARAVQRMLRARFEVTYRDEQLTALEVLSGLFARPYRIVHLAGHGHYEAPTTPGAKARSGMVLDSGIFLTAVEIQQMQQVPELVFLNCCHIGQTGPAAPRGAGGGVEFNRLAASVSRELIEMGVRAVVAAGWAVNDAAAKAFGEVFYGEMLDGNTFGRALKRAREETYGRFPESNTWGAYQAYGDPDYRLDPTGAAASRSFTEHVDAAEFVEAVRDIGRSARRTTAGDADGSKQRVVLATRLSDLVRDCPSEWLEQADVLMAIGYAYGDLGEFDRACHYLAPALAGDGDAGTTTLRAVEQLANFEARLADEDARDPAARKLARAKLEAAIDRLVRLIAVAGTAERYALLGGAYRRLATVEDTREGARATLEKATESYRCAHARNVERKRFDPYPVLNWLSCAQLVGRPVPDADTLIARCEATARERYRATRDFFDAVHIADAALLRALGAGVLGEKGEAADAEVHRLAEEYREVFQLARPNAREIDSVAKQLKRLGTLLEALAFARSETIGEHLEALRAALGGSSRGPAGADRPAKGPVAGRTAGGKHTKKEKAPRRKKGQGGISS